MASPERTPDHDSPVGATGFRRVIIAVICSAAMLAACERSVPSRFDVDVIADSLETPWSMAFAEDGRLFVAERGGRIRVVRDTVVEREPWAVIPVHESSRQGFETGLMGLALDPRFSQSHRVYVCYTHDDHGRLFNRIAVLTEQRGTDARLDVLLDSIPAGQYHNGCRLAFGPDGKLYATTGDAASTRDAGTAAQSTSSLAGKVLRLNADGSIPADNPSPHSAVWSLGHRNPQGIAFRPGSDRPLITEHGTGAAGNNELNRIVRGGNYGWPIAIGTSTNSQFVNPILVRPEAWSGATFVRGDRYPGLHGWLVVASLSAERLLGVSFRADGSVAATVVLADKQWGRLRDVIEGPDGCLYVATSNRDGRGTPRSRDDQILRLREVRH